MKRGRMLAMLAGLAAPAAAAQAPVPPAPEALVDRYMAAIPQSRDEVNAGRAENEVARLLRANPGGDEAAVRAAVDALETCFSSTLNANTDGAIRATVRAMGAEKLDRLIAFYIGPDHRAFAAIVDANEHGEMTEAQRAERRRIESSYVQAQCWSGAVLRISPRSPPPRRSRSRPPCRRNPKSRRGRRRSGRGPAGRRRRSCLSPDRPRRRRRCRRCGPRH